MPESAKQKETKPTEAAETRLLVRHGFELARELGIEKVLVLTKLVIDRRLVAKHREEETLIWVSSEAPPDKPAKRDFYVEAPEVESDRISQVTVGLMIAVFHRVVEATDSILCLTGVAGSNRIDNLLIANPQRDFPWFSRYPNNNGTPELPYLRNFVHLLGIALRFAAEGREGKPIGTIFVLGRPRELQKHWRPMILNPLKGHTRKARSIQDPKFFETMRELAALDGAFVIGPRGVVERAGVYLDAPVTKRVEVSRGLGSRHVAAAAITAATDATTIVISESSGKITVFRRGLELMSLDGRA